MACLAFYFLGNKESENGDSERYTTELVLQQIKSESRRPADSMRAKEISAGILLSPSHAKPIKQVPKIASSLLPPRSSLSSPGTVSPKALSKPSTDTSNSVWDRKNTRLLENKIEKVRPGDSLASIFSRLDIPAKQLQLVLDSDKLSKRLQRIYPGHDLEFLINTKNELVRLTYKPSLLQSLTFKRSGDTFKATLIDREPDPHIVYQHAIIDSSLFLAGQRVGFNDDLTLRLAHIFQWDIDFVLDIRKNDQFHVIFEELYLDNEFLGYGQILAAEFKNQNDTYKAVRYTNSAGESDYYSPNGDNMRKAFLRAPVEFSRISSNFNPRRLHPVRKHIAPHRGIDYAAPTGTPILAAGNGKIVAASKSGPNGNYVFIQHGEQFQTKYLHLSKFARGIRRGKKVNQGQVIGYVGSTGWATGAHLHYEFLVNGVHKNPRTIKLPKADAITASEQNKFSLKADKMFDLLNSHKQQQVALVP
ncbi:MAG: peptidoglycan DD-metalloendopeptidase family protein [Pseudomonadales bacterium]|nr:peptidoglycan DD-metalloendopeptidase family protein [Pseudomonadales bacterium]